MFFKIKNGKGWKRSEGFFSGDMKMNCKVDLKKHGFFEWGCDGRVRSGKRYEYTGLKCKSIAKEGAGRAKIQKWKHKKIT